jgi:RNA polymerase sigma-70 factor (ECF subfamily)
VTSHVIGMALDHDSASRPIESDVVLELFDRHHRRLYQLARRLSSTSDEAHDLVQDTFLRVAGSNVAAPATPAEAEAWLVRILVNLCRDRWRARLSRRRLDATFPLTSWMTPATDPEARLVAQSAIWTALAQLPPRRRAVIVLHELEGLSVEKTCAALGITKVTVRWHLARGRRELADIVTRLGGKSV